MNKDISTVAFTAYEYLVLVTSNVNVGPIYLWLATLA